MEEVEAENPMDKGSPVICSDSEEGDIVSVNHIVNKRELFFFN